MYYRGAQAAIVVYDITNTVSHAFCNNVNCLNPEVLLDVLCMLIIQVSAVRLRRVFVFSTSGLVLFAMNITIALCFLINIANLKCNAYLTLKMIN